jgi:hypothetical protein
MILTAPSVFAAEAKMLECREVDDQMSWSVVLNSDLTLGSFFDNDHDTALARTDVHFYDSLPAETVYDFEGNDDGARIKFLYVSQTKSATLYVNDGQKGEYSVAFECRLVKDRFDWMGVADAIRTAPQNDGSTRF